MIINMSATLKDAIRDVLDRTERDNGILDAYGAAAKIQKELPSENVALEDIIAALMHGRGAIQAIEFTPPVRGIIVEIVMPGGETERNLARDDNVVVVPG